MTNTIPSQNIDLSSWDTLYIDVSEERTAYIFNVGEFAVISWFT
jgi:hypothetical protein